MRRCLFRAIGSRADVGGERRRSNARAGSLSLRLERRANATRSWLRTAQYRSPGFRRTRTIADCRRVRARASLELTNLLPHHHSSGCPGTASEQAGKASACEGCPNQAVCATAPKGPDPGARARAAGKKSGRDACDRRGGRAARCANAGALLAPPLSLSLSLSHTPANAHNHNHKHNHNHTAQTSSPSPSASAT